MLFDGIKLVEGSEINNLVVQTGTSWPSAPSEGELFYMRESGVDSEGLYVYDGVDWLRTNNEFAQSDILTALGFTPANKAGDTFTGPVILSGAPSIGLEAATKDYVDATAGAIGSASQPLDADLTAIAGLSSTGLLRRTGTNLWSLDTNTYLTGNQSITFSGDVNGSGTTSVTLTLGTSGVTAGSYGTASSVPTVNVDTKGRVVSASNTPIAIDASQVSTGTFSNSRISQASVTQHQAALTIAESQITDGALLARVAGNETITGTWAFSVIPTAPTPTSGSQLANKDYVDNIAAGISPQRGVKVATTANITLSGLQTLDGYSVQVGDRVLVKDQSVGSQNGVYVAAAGAWSRSTDFDGSPTNEVSSGALVYVEQGTSSGNSSWVLITADPITIGTTSLQFSIFSRPGDFVAGAGLTKTGNQFDVGTASTARIVVNADSIDLATAGTAGTYTSVTTDAYGRVTAGSNPGFITGNQNITVSGDATGSGTTAIALTLVASGVSAGTYNNSATAITPYTVDSKGRLTSVGSAITITPAWGSITSKPTTVNGFGITDAVLKTGDTMSGSLVVNSNIGIGAASPEARLHTVVTDGVRVTNAIFQQTGQSTFVIQGQQGSADLGAANGTLLYNSVGNLGFRNGTSGTAQALLDASGNFLIGGTAVEVTGGKAVQVENATNATLVLKAYNGTTRADFQSGNGDASIGTVTAHPMYFKTGGIERMRIDSSGKMNIGQSVTDGAGDLNVRNVGGNTGSGSLSLAAAPGGGGVSYLLMGNSNGGGVAGPSMIVAANRSLSFGVGSSFSARDGGTFTEYARVDGSGNLGIGTSSPSAKLDIGSSTALQAQMISARGSDANFQLVTRNGSAANTSGQAIFTFGSEYNLGGLTAGLEFKRGGGSTDTSLVLWAGGSARATFDGGGGLTVPGTFTNRGGRGAVVNPTTPLDGDIQVSGSVIYIYASGAWRQVFPAVYA